ncbi:hypothetical protein [uncultured Flavobacterium sp.]|uniref:hypothetical protein n=1 Tax=uncultured Flavobacterium sp. TaxID=165435 RepID=UPI00259A2F6C|nr:hypothetical protein [uncultured Flavobacterium sp.]
MKINIDKFKNDILFDAIHKTERSDKLRDYLDIANHFLRTNKEGYYSDHVWINVLEKPNIFYVFRIIASQVLYHENLLLLLDELKEINYKTTWVVSFDYDYYKDFFNERIKNSKAILRKLRPFILEASKGYSSEIKEKDLNSDIGKFFKGWYIELPSN